METMLVSNDWQIPFDDVISINAMLTYAVDIQPDIFVLLGDILDFPGLSTKFLRSRTDRFRVVQDIDQAKGYLAQVRTLLPNTRIVFIEGNHEERLRRYILERADELEEFIEDGQALTMASLLGIPAEDYFGPYGEAYIHKSFVLKHGDSATRNAASTELALEGSSGMSGHTHRLQVAAKTDRSGEHAWYSNMALCNIAGPNQPPAALKGSTRLRNQQQGFATIFFNDTQFNVYQTVIINHTFIGPNGKEYGVRL